MQSVHPFRVRCVALSVAGIMAGCQPDPPLEPARSCTSGFSATFRGTVRSSWPTYGADPQRTSVSLAWCKGPLTPTWSFHPEDVDGREALAKHVVVDDRGVFVAAVIGESTAGYRLRLEDGSEMWTYDSRTDIHHGRWPSLVFGWVVLNDDGLFVLDPTTGEKPFNKGVDWWGQTLTDGQRLYLVNTYHIHGPQVFVAALDQEMETVWEQNVLGAIPEDYLDRVGAIALDEGTLFQAVDMRWGGLNGLFAFDAATGKEKWNSPTFPASAISASSGQLYALERPERDDDLELVAREQGNGSVVWRVPLDTDRAAPAVAEDLLITYTQHDGVVARETDTGREVWHQAVPTGDSEPVAHATHLAVAWLSQTVVVVAGDQMAVLGLRDGRVQWTGQAPGNGDEPSHSPVVAEGMVYMVRGGTVHALACE